MNPVAGTYFDGETLRGVPVTLDFSTPGCLRIVGEGLELTPAWPEVAVSDRLADIARFIYLPGRAVVETLANDAIDAALRAERRGRFSGLVHTLEKHSGIAAGAALLIGLCAVLAFYFGLPVLSRHTAQRTPPAVEARIGQISLAAFNEYFNRSELTAAQRTRVKTQLERLLPDRDEAARPRLVFRALGPQAPNAFALPGNIIIVSDELIGLADDDELAAVLAHEIGHLELKHGIQGALRSSFALLVVSALTGDLSSLTTFAGSIPWLILNNGYSREFEREADEFAHALMLKRGVRLKHFASILKKLEEATAGPGRAARRSYLGTHPPTEERIRLFQPHPDAPKPKTPSPPPSAPATVTFTPPKPATTTTTRSEIVFPPSGSSPIPAPTELPVFLKPGSLSAYQNSEPPLEIIEQRRAYKLPHIQIPARVKKTSRLRFPEEMRRQKLEGEAVVDLIVDRYGNARAAYVVRATNEIFARSALESLENWEFYPARLDQTPVNARIRLPIRFTINSSRESRPIEPFRFTPPEPNTPAKIKLDDPLSKP